MYQSLGAITQAMDRLHEAVQELPEHTRRILVMHRVAALSQEEIAQRSGLDPRTVERHLIKAIAHLEQRLFRKRG